VQSRQPANFCLQFFQAAFGLVRAWPATKLTLKACPAVKQSGTNTEFGSNLGCAGALARQSFKASRLYWQPSDSGSA
jgi:hypothetical protein